VLESSQKKSRNRARNNRLNPGTGHSSRPTIRICPGTGRGNRNHSRICRQGGIEAVLFGSRIGRRLRISGIASVALFLRGSDGSRVGSRLRHSLLVKQIPNVHRDGHESHHSQTHEKCHEYSGLPAFASQDSHHGQPLFCSPQEQISESPPDLPITDLRRKLDAFLQQNR
jgi:hypothetical protein